MFSVNSNLIFKYDLNEFKVLKFFIKPTVFAQHILLANV